MKKRNVNFKNFIRECRYYKVVKKSYPTACLVWNNNLKVFYTSLFSYKYLKSNDYELITDKKIN